MRFTVSKRIAPGLSGGVSFGGGRPARVRLSKRIVKGLWLTGSKSLATSKRR